MTFNYSLQCNHFLFLSPIWQPTGYSILLILVLVILVCVYIVFCSYVPVSPDQQKWNVLVSEAAHYTSKVCQIRLLF